MTQDAKGYPRPMMVRDGAVSLNGKWKFAFSDATLPGNVHYDRTIMIPFTPESPLSGIGDMGFHDSTWSMRTFRIDSIKEGGRILLHFGAVDYHAEIWIDHQYVGRHTGGYTPFTLDITRFLKLGHTQKLAVHAKDNPHNAEKPIGKQHWELEFSGIWGPRMTGIWQTVWLEQVGEVSVAKIVWRPSLKDWRGVDLKVILDGNITGSDIKVNVRLSVWGKTLTNDQYSSEGKHEIERHIIIDGAEAFQNRIVWHPTQPTLIRAEIIVLKNGIVVDRVESYTALRSVGITDGQLLFNGRPQFLRMILNQGFWPDGHYTAPTDAALRKDVELIKQMGFNGVRMHQKIEDPRFLYWCDVIGLYVSGELPSPWQFSPKAVDRVSVELSEVISRDGSHPSIILWIPWNESWGVPDLQHDAAHRNAVRWLYHQAKTLDPTRLVIGNDGWENGRTDIIGVHDYDPKRLKEGYGPQVSREELFNRWYAGGRRVIFPEDQSTTRIPFMLTEFGGFAIGTDDPKKEGWGYLSVRDAIEFAEKFSEVVASAKLPPWQGFCYTQFCDTFLEWNGLLKSDRTPKMPLERIRAIVELRQ